MPANRQTISFLTRRFAEVGLEPDSRHGQNFLIDLNLIQLLADAAELGPNDVVLEVGTGTGSLTGLMAAKAAHVVTVEIDAHLYQLAHEELYDFDNVTMLKQDALRNKNNYADEVLEQVRSQLAAEPGRRFKLAANLPYNVATPVISNLLLTDIVPDLISVTIQKELAERIVARPRTKDYSALSVWIQSQCHAEIVRIMPPSVFWPRPKVESAILRIQPDPQLRQRIPDIAYFHAFTRAMFFHRRKFLRSELLSAFKKRIDKPAVDQVMAELDLPPNARAEELPVETMLALCEAMRASVPDLKL